MLKDGVGEMQEKGEFGLGLAPRNAKPTNKIEPTKTKDEKGLTIKEMDDLEERKDLLGGEDEDESKMEIIRLKK